jgi:hypothetical protein
LVEVVKMTGAQMQELQKQYPEAFKRPYHQGSGLTLERMFHQDGQI